MSWQALFALAPSHLSAGSIGIRQEQSGCFVTMRSQHEDKNNPLQHG